MKTYIIVIVIGFLTISCSKNDEDQIKADPDNEISFQIERLNSNENFVSKAKYLTFKDKLEYWHQTDDEKIHLWRATIFDLELENGKKLEFRITFSRGGVNKDLLILEDKNSDPWLNNWDFKSFETETTDFHQYEGLRRSISIDSQYFYVNSGNGGNFSFVSSEKVLVNGEEKSYITMSFEGNSYGGAYSPEGPFLVLKITNGTFKGVLE